MSGASGGDLLPTLAFAYRRKGADAMERSKLLHLLAFDLRWLSPDQAKRAVQRALEAGLLREEGDRLRVAFDPDAVEVPLNFRPREDVADQPVQLARPPPPPKGDPDAAEAEKERARRGGLVTPDVARLLVARRKGEDVRGKAREAEAALARK